MVKIAPSILAANFEVLENEIRNVAECGADVIHVDIMDGKFVKNETPGMEMYKTAVQIAVLPVDTHLMVENPEGWIGEILTVHNNIVESNIEVSHSQDDIITFHIETVNEMVAYKLIDKIHGAGLKVGIAIKPNTELEEILPFIPLIDMVLIMTVEPGYGGQTLIESCLEKVKELRDLEPNIDIEVDGGINLENISKVKKAGANVIVAGTAIFNTEDRRDAINSLRDK